MTSSRTSSRHPLFQARREERRNRAEFYTTPAELTEAMLAVESFEGMTIWECACGRGDISEVLIVHGLDVYSSDLHDRGYGEAGIDFMSTWRDVDCIITNPPYIDSQHADFALRAVLMAKRKVALLLPLTFFESPRRNKFLDWSPLKCVCLFTYRHHCLWDGFTGTPAQGKGFGWFVWEQGWTQEPLIRFLQK